MTLIIKVSRKYWNNRIGMTNSVWAYDSHVLGASENFQLLSFFYFFVSITGIPNSKEYIVIIAYIGKYRCE
jgi:hypothetical protein